MAVKHKVTIRGPIKADKKNRTDNLDQFVRCSCGWSFHTTNEEDAKRVAAEHDHYYKTGDG